MLVQSLLPLVTYALQATAIAVQRQTPTKTSGKCPSGVHIIGVRGTLEDPGFGALQAVVDRVTAKIPGSDSKAIEYPASGITIGQDGKPIFNFIEYTKSETMGLASLSSELEEFGDECPDTDIVLMGYSQGAHIVGDALCGRRGILFPPFPPVSDFFLHNVKAIIQLGDPTNRRSLPWHMGSSTQPGIFPRVDLYQCEPYGDLWQSWCDKDDFFCDRGESIPIHLGYVERYCDDIVDFIVNKVKEPKPDAFEYRVPTNDDL